MRDDSAGSGRTDRRCAGGGSPEYHRRNDDIPVRTGGGGDLSPRSSMQGVPAGPPGRPTILSRQSHGDYSHDGRNAINTHPNDLHTEGYHTQQGTINGYHQQHGSGFSGVGVLTGGGEAGGGGGGLEGRSGPEKLARGMFRLPSQQASAHQHMMQRDQQQGMGSDGYSPPIGRAASSSYTQSDGQKQTHQTADGGSSHVHRDTQAMMGAGRGLARAGAEGTQSGGECDAQHTDTRYSLYSLFIFFSGVGVLTGGGEAGGGGGGLEGRSGPEKLARGMFRLPSQQASAHQHMMQRDQQQGMGSDGYSPPIGRAASSSYTQSDGQKQTHQTADGGSSHVHRDTQAMMGAGRGLARAGAEGTQSGGNYGQQGTINGYHHQHGSGHSGMGVLTGGGETSRGGVDGADAVPYGRSNLPFDRRLTAGGVGHASQRPGSPQFSGVGVLTGGGEAGRESRRLVGGGGGATSGADHGDLTSQYQHQQQQLIMQQQTYVPHMGAHSSTAGGPPSRAVLKPASSTQGTQSFQQPHASAQQASAHQHMMQRDQQQGMGSDGYSPPIGRAASSSYTNPYGQKQPQTHQTADGGSSHVHRDTQAMMGAGRGQARAGAEGTQSGGNYGQQGTINGYHHQHGSGHSGMGVLTGGGETSRGGVDGADAVPYGRSNLPFDRRLTAGGVGHASQRPGIPQHSGMGVLTGGGETNGVDYGDLTSQFQQQQQRFIMQQQTYVPHMGAHSSTAGGPPSRAVLKPASSTQGTQSFQQPHALSQQASAHQHMMQRDQQQGMGSDGYSPPIGRAASSSYTNPYGQKQPQTHQTADGGSSHVHRDTQAMMGAGRGQARAGAEGTQSGGYHTQQGTINGYDHQHGSGVSASHGNAARGCRRPAPAARPRPIRWQPGFGRAGSGLRGHGAAMDGIGGMGGPEYEQHLQGQQFSGVGVLTGGGEAGGGGGGLEGRSGPEKLARGMFRLPGGIHAEPRRPMANGDGDSVRGEQRGATHHEVSPGPLPKAHTPHDTPYFAHRQTNGRGGGGGPLPLHPGMQDRHARYEPSGEPSRRPGLSRRDQQQVESGPASPAPRRPPHPVSKRDKNGRTPSILPQPTPTPPSAARAKPNSRQKTGGVGGVAGGGGVGDRPGGELVEWRKPYSASVLRADGGVTPTHYGVHPATYKQQRDHHPQGRRDLSPLDSDPSRFPSGPDILPRPPPARGCKKPTSKNPPPSIHRNSKHHFKAARRPETTPHPKKQTGRQVADRREGPPSPSPPSAKAQVASGGGRGMGDGRTPGEATQPSMFEGSTVLHPMADVHRPMSVASASPHTNVRCTSPSRGAGRGRRRAMSVPRAIREDPREEGHMNRVPERSEGVSLSSRQGRPRGGGGGGGRARRGMYSVDDAAYRKILKDAHARTTHMPGPVAGHSTDGVAMSLEFWAVYDGEVDARRYAEHAQIPKQTNEAKAKHPSSTPSSPVSTEVRMQQGERQPAAQEEKNSPISTTSAPQLTTTKTKTKTDTGSPVSSSSSRRPEGAAMSLHGGAGGSPLEAASSVRAWTMAERGAVGTPTAPSRSFGLRAVAALPVQGDEPTDRTIGKEGTKDDID
ncbi:unnamed protein product [Vitrella brassicaformis CCMP3155]|uniref:Uncharacterized protein n=1 Tax=Vitrella brassicaformis (strain CCMP3155) TaxID=1169540 RepID=A0A0G4GU57_VITBC|nr:unnamed protein product [Vitrella brassicaformis CCMP3155]|eukprot:CEM34312.1 unnamed protein product [Vitrella brassicaformis CCMP3155]